jgi:hypothetical protein
MIPERVFFQLFPQNVDWLVSIQSLPGQQMHLRRKGRKGEDASVVSIEVELVRAKRLDYFALH